MNKKRKFLEKVTHKSWWDTLDPLVQDQRFDKILLTIVKRKKEGIKIFPPLEDMLRAFRVTIRERVKVCILAQDPYPQRDGEGCVATGLAFANDPLSEKRMSPSLVIVIEELIEDQKINEWEFFDKTDFLHWVKQDVLLLNSSLSVEENDVGSHSHIWKYFIDGVVKTLPKDVIKVAMGRQAKKIMTNSDIETYHPAADIYSGTRLFRGCGVFSEINSLLSSKGEEKILWG